jgi:hypothetical protein
MNPERNIEREILTEQVLDATTLPEIAAAKQALRNWIATYPEEAEFMRDGFSQLYLLEEIAREQQSERVATASHTHTQSA